MSKENQKLSYNEIMEELAQLCHTKSTGTMFIVSDKGHSSRVSLKEGEILFFAYRMNKGLDALFDLYDMNSGKYHFSKGVYNPYNVLDLPETSQLLQYFKLKTFPKNISAGDQTGNVANSTKQKVASVSAGKAEYKSSKITQIIDHIETSLMNYLGPFANISIHDYLADNKKPETQAEFRKMIDFLTLEIDDRNDQNAFKNEIIKLIS